MATTYYYTVNGNLLGEATGGVETTYIPDALGSTTQTATSAGVQNQYVYSPYGRLIAKSGTAADPKFLWNGRTQSRTTGCAYAEQYNRRRHVSTTTAQWTTVDPVWPTQPAYVFVDGEPITFADPTGLSCVKRSGRNNAQTCADCYEYMVNNFSSFPNTSAFGGCTFAGGHKCDSPIPLTPALMVCLKYKESCWNKGDVGVGHNIFNMTLNMIEEFCSDESRKCLPGAIGLSDSAAASAPSCVNAIKSSQTLQDRLALLGFSCFPGGFKGAYGYGNTYTDLLPLYKQLFQDCSDCLSLSIAAGIVASAASAWCPISNPLPCQTCMDLMSIEQHDINNYYKKYHGRR